MEDKSVLNTPQLEPASPFIEINGEKVPSCQCLLGVNRWAYVQCKTKRNFYKAKHQESLQREADLKEQLEAANAEIRLLKQKLFGKRSEQGNNSEKQTKQIKPKPKGQQKGSKGHGRNKQTDLEVIDEFIDLPKEKQACPSCHLPFCELNTTDDSSILEIRVKAHVRKIKRKKYKRNKNCQCPQTPIIITAPPALRLLNKMTLGISIWVDILIRKYEEQCPLNRILGSIKKHGIVISKGTVTGGLKRLLPIFEPIAKAFEKHCQQDTHWHADETRWEVFEKIPGKNTYRWYLWVFRGREAVTYRIEPTRGYKVPEDFFKDVKGGILSCDRYVVYKMLANNSAIILALCWAHVRRDFLDVMKAHPTLEDWAMEWVQDIRDLYQLNKQRLKFEQNIQAYQNQDKILKEKLELMQSKFKLQLDTDTLHFSCKKVLTSLKNHWKGLVIFQAHPEIPMDNNKGEQSIRPSTIGRKNYYGSGSVWSAVLTGMLFTIFATLSLWKLNSRSWLYAYLKACENNTGKSPDILTQFLPWEMTAEQLNKLSKPPDYG